MPRYKPLYLDDIKVGDRFTSESCMVTQDDIIKFAREYDPQPFHTDPEAAKTTLFGGLIASGWHTASLTMRLMVTGSVPIATGLIGLEGQMAWPKPVRPGDSLHVESEILEIIPSRSQEDRGVVVVRNTTLNQNNEAVQVMTAKLLAFRRPKK